MKVIFHIYDRATLQSHFYSSLKAITLDPDNNVNIGERQLHKLAKKNRDQRSPDYADAGIDAGYPIEVNGVKI